VCAGETHCRIVATVNGDSRQAHYAGRDSTSSQQRGIHVGTLFFVRWTSLILSRTLWVLDSLQWSDGSTPEQLKGHYMCWSKEISDLESFLRHAKKHHSVGVLRSISARLQ
jgi:hypothetical protein